MRLVGDPRRAQLVLEPGVDALLAHLGEQLGGRAVGGAADDVQHLVGGGGLGTGGGGDVGDPGGCRPGEPGTRQQQPAPRQGSRRRALGSRQRPVLLGAAGHWLVPEPRRDHCPVSDRPAGPADLSADQPPGRVRNLTACSGLRHSRRRGEHETRHNRVLHAYNQPGTRRYAVIRVRTMSTGRGRRTVPLGLGPHERIGEGARPVGARRLRPPAWTPRDPAGWTRRSTGPLPAGTPPPGRRRARSDRPGPPRAPASARTAGWRRPPPRARPAP